MSEGIFSDFDAVARALWGHHDVKLRHRLHERSLFSDAALGRILDAIPPGQMAINTMGRTGHDVRSWSYCERGDMSGEELIKAVNAGRIWINVTKANEIVPEFGALLSEMFGEIEANVPDLDVIRKSMGLLISSPNAQVFYHADVPGQSLWQIRGEKRIYIYPNREPFLRPADLENIIRGRTEEEVPYHAWFDRHAAVHDLAPGDMLHWPLNGPHRVENKDCLNISITTEHWTPEIRRHFGVQYGNGILRSAGLAPRSASVHGAAAYAKCALAVGWRLSGQQKRQSFRRTMKYRLDSREPGYLVPIGGALQAGE
ncbi:cupin-like domain-containing protein [Pararhizobium haloflavum]|uniref:cupin-like domain-containing protein n=1 Tax=Pararhizobium haloflavum TaxID=2037914 RepID=UPI000C199490|nr:cupin-like domain-containing protein [Pararhizobium haloflavum]